MPCNAQKKDWITEVEIDAFIEFLHRSSAEEIEEMRRIGEEPGAYGLDEDGRVAVVQSDGTLQRLR